MQKFIQKVQNKENLTQDEIQKVMRGIMSGTAHQDEISELLLALRDKGPTIDEITGAAKIMRQFVLEVKTKHKNILDTCGTGGDHKNTFNISTITAFVVAGAGVVVAKHGNRSVSSTCGSACVLEGLGVNLNVEDAHLTECLDKIGIAFLFAQKLHPAMKNAAPARQALKVETIFNVLGPLTNPANATHQVMGVYSRDLVEPLAHVLQNLGLKRALVVHGSDGLDEITTTGTTFISEYNGKNIISYHIDPQELGIPLARPEDLTSDNLQENIKIFRDILDGKKGPQRDIVVLNAAYALYAAQKADNIIECLKIAQESIDTKKAKGKLEDLIKITNTHPFPSQ